jgi:hypothetical protein
MPVDIDDAMMLSIAEVNDRLTTAQIFKAGGSPNTAVEISSRLYQAARAKQGGRPLSYIAAKSLCDACMDGGFVIISTGFFVPPFMSEETDGPIGAASLSRALSLGFGANVVICTEPMNVPRMVQLCQASGLRPKVLNNSERPLLHAAEVGILESPRDIEKARKHAVAMIELLQPSAIVFVERPSMNSKGVWHNSMLHDVTPIVGKADFLAKEAIKRRILTIGIGDGGNEIGMGIIEKEVREIIPAFSSCHCGCGGGTAAATSTDVLVVGSTGNWAIYAIEATLAAGMGYPDILHDTVVERRLQEASVRAGLINPSSGLAHAWVDSTPEDVSLAIITLLDAAVRCRISDKFLPRLLTKESSKWRDKPEEVKSLIQEWHLILRNQENED